MIIPWMYFIHEGEQLVVESFTRRRVVNGPGQYVARPFERIRRRKGVRLGPEQFLRLVNTLSGKLYVVTGPRLYFLEAQEEIDEAGTALSLRENQYAHILNTQSGAQRSIRGPQLYFLEADEKVVDVLNATPLKESQYVRILDKSSGQVRVVRGEATVYLEPNESVIGSKVEDGVDIDEQTAVVVRDIRSGQLALVTEPQVFIPEAGQEIVDVRERIRLEDHEVVIVKDGEGRYTFKQGRDAERSFFLDPYSELVTLKWSSGIHKDRRELTITHIDTRPKYMWYEFEVRTQDNVELVVGITFFWQVGDVQAMIRMTDDTAGDVCSHARSTIIQAVSKVTLEAFLDDFNNIVRRAAMNDEQGFYASRGVQIHSVEVRSVSCKDPETQHILMEIIQETTNRLNRLQKQESENEVQLKHLQGEIEAEMARGELLAARREHARVEALTDGEAEAERVRQFLDGLGDHLAMDQKVAIYNMLRKKDILDALSKGSASLYFTPSDVDLRIEA